MPQKAALIATVILHEAGQEGEDCPTITALWAQGIYHDDSELRQIPAGALFNAAHTKAMRHWARATAVADDRPHELFLTPFE
jgi:hypothetical protein